MKIEINVPSTLNEIPLSRYQAFAKVSQTATGELLERKMVSIFCDIDIQSVLKIKKTSIDDIIEHLSNLFSQETPFVKSFTLGKGANKMEFGFIPNLEDITLDEYADLDSYINDWDEMHKAMAVCYRPITDKVKDKYLIREYEGTDEFRELMKHTPLDVVLSARLFFWNLANELVRSTRHSLIAEMEMEILSNQKITSPNNGDGTPAFTHSLKEIFEHLKQSENFQLPKPSLF